MTSTPVEELAETFVELAGSAVDELDLDDFLDLLADRCVRLLDVSAAVLSLVEEGDRPHVTGASDDEARMLAQLEDGPGQACFHAGEPVTVPDLAGAAARWPEFTVAATSAGFASVHAVPVRRRADVVGALTLYRSTPGEPDKATDRIAQALANLAAIVLLQVRTLQQQAELAAQLQRALTSRVLIEQAKGMTAARLGVGMDAAFEALRQYARSHNERIADLAAAVVDGSFDTTRLRPHN